jgi:hypothetical protein
MVVCPFVLFLLAIVLSVLLRYTVSAKFLIKGLLSLATFQLIFHTVQLICCDLQMIYDQSFCYLCVGAGNLYHSLLLNNQFYPLAIASCPLDKELSSGQTYPIE